MAKSVSKMKNKPRKRKRRHGFLKRQRSAGGRATLKRRRQKGRHKLTV
jgi:large subunit ribosomal protein L34